MTNDQLDALQCNDEALNATASAVLQAIDPEPSKFGAGIVVCLAKFSEHLCNDWFDRVRHVAQWSKMSEPEKARMTAEAKKYPVGDSARFMLDISFSGTSEAALSHYIELWMNAASDHFYDLDRKRSPESLCELATLCLRIGHGFTGEIWTWETVDEIHRLWKQACLDLDASIGVKADWGQW